MRSGGQVEILVDVKATSNEQKESRSREGSYESGPGYNYNASVWSTGGSGDRAIPGTRFLLAEGEYHFSQGKHNTPQAKIFLTGKRVVAEKISLQLGSGRNKRFAETFRRLAEDSRRFAERSWRDF
jgi:hypothetical protein